MFLASLLDFHLVKVYVSVGICLQGFNMSQEINFHII